MPLQNTANITSSLGATDFIQINNPADGSWRKIARSYAARRRHASARQQRVQKHNSLSAALPSQQSGTWHGSAADSELPLVPGRASLYQIRGIDPFDSLARPTTRFESFLMNHYINHVVVNANICKGLEQETVARTQPRRSYNQLVFTDRGMLDAALLSTCRSLVALQVPGRYYEQALKYKGDCIQSLNNAISREGRSPSATTIVTTLALASDAFTTGEVAVAKKHCDAVEAMIRLKGHPYTFGEDAILAAMVSWISHDTKVKREDHPGKAICNRIKQSQ